MTNIPKHKRPPGRPQIIIDRVTITRSVPRTAVAIIDEIIKELKQQQQINHDKTRIKQIR